MFFTRNKTHLSRSKDKVLLGCGFSLVVEYFNVIELTKSVSHLGDNWYSLEAPHVHL